MLPLPVLIDECVRRGVATVFVKRNHIVRYAAEELGQGTPDRLVAKAADTGKMVLVTCNYPDFKSLISRRPPNNKMDFRYAGLITFEGMKDTRTDSRIAQTIELIEYEYQLCQTRTDKRLIVGIFNDHLRIG